MGRARGSLGCLQHFDLTGNGHFNIRVVVGFCPINFGFSIPLVYLIRSYFLGLSLILARHNLFLWALIFLIFFYQNSFSIGTACIFRHLLNHCIPLFWDDLELKTFFDFHHCFSNCHKKLTKSFTNTVILFSHHFD